MKKLIVLMVILAITGLAVPAFAQFPINWSDGFNWGDTGETLAGHRVDGSWWVQPVSTFSPLIAETKVKSPMKSIRQQPGKVSAAKVDLKNQNTLNKVYYQGVMRFWIYDTGGTGNNTDTRCGVFSNYAAAGDVGSMTYVQAVGITSSRIPTGFFYVYASSGFVAMDGLSTNTVANYVLTSAGLKPAPRVVNAWSNVIIGWNIDPVAKLLHSDYYVNPDFSSPDIQLNAMLDCDGNGSGTRFNAIKDVAGVFIGGNTAWPNPGYVDDISFSGDTMDPEAVQTLGLIPEPTGLMALGTGMIGLLGLIRRRK